MIGIVVMDVPFLYKLDDIIFIIVGIICDVALVEYYVVPFVVGFIFYYGIIVIILSNVFINRWC